MPALSNSATIWPRGNSPRFPPVAAVESSENCFASVLKSSPFLTRSSTKRFLPNGVDFFRLLSLGFEKDVLRRNEFLQPVVFHVLVEVVMKFLIGGGRFSVVFHCIDEDVLRFPLFRHLIAGLVLLVEIALLLVGNRHLVSNFAGSMTK